MNELLKLPKEKRPEFVTMVDIDEVVMEACAEHMPNVCGPYLQKNYWNGPNYRIIAGCAIQFMKDCQVSINCRTKQYYLVRKRTYTYMYGGTDHTLFFKKFVPRVTLHPCVNSGELKMSNCI